MRLPRRPTAGRIWECKIGDAQPRIAAADAPMRDAVRLAYIIVTGREPRFFFSGWGGKLTVVEQSCVSGQRARRLDKRTRAMAAALRAMLR